MLNLNDIILEIALIHPYIFNLTHYLAPDAATRRAPRRRLGERLENPLAAIRATLDAESVHVFYTRSSPAHITQNACLCIECASPCEDWSETTSRPLVDY